LRRSPSGRSKSIILGVFIERIGYIWDKAIQSAGMTTWVWARQLSLELVGRESKDSA
jgi:hypothetical protein